MSNLKDTDFDDLFRRASDKYPLRTDSSDWNRMAAALEKDPFPDASDDVDNIDRSRKRRFFWWFLLLPLAGIGYYTVHQTGRSGQRTANAVTVTSTTASGVAVTKPAATDATGNNAAAAKNAAANNAAANNAANTTGATKSAANGGGMAKTTPNSGATAQNTTDNTTPALSGGPAGAGMPRKAPRMVNSTNPKNSGKGIRSAGGDVPVRPQTAGNAPIAGNAPVRPQTNVTDEANNNSDDRFADKSTQIDPRTNPIAASFTLRNAPVNQQRARIADPYALTIKVKAKEIKSDSAKPKAKRQSYLYAGIVAAPDLSTVKFQSTKGVGSTFGVLIGYAFNRHWAIETGAYVDRKRYYTDGEYFSKEKINLASNIDLVNADGTCYMWEIPLNVRYTFNPEGKTRWFATAGLSTYLMNREKYNFEEKYYGGTWSWPYYRDWKKSSQYPFSIIGFSAGFERSLGNVGNLRIEPYVRVPLGGIGTGNLPIMSTGINIGITRRLWK
jgi:hypothetical protein